MLSALNGNKQRTSTTQTDPDTEQPVSLCFVGPVILSAPLQTVLDNLDVLEELVILLDPESHGVKNTKHLASHCSFRSTWITYTYSMKDSKSPLKAVLEGVTSRHPDWTVGHLAELLRLIERNDAVAVLSKLKLNSVTMQQQIALQDWWHKATDYFLLNSDFILGCHIAHTYCTQNTHIEL